MNDRQSARCHDQTAIRRAIPSDGTTDWMMPNWAAPAAIAGSRMTATRVTLGAICLSISTHLPLSLYSNAMKPVALPPGRARLSTKPAPTGSGTSANTSEGLAERKILEFLSGPSSLRLDVRLANDAAVVVILFAKICSELRTACRDPIIPGG